MFLTICCSTGNSPWTHACFVCGERGDEVDADLRGRSGEIRAFLQASFEETCKQSIVQTFALLLQYAQTNVATIEWGIFTKTDSLE